MITFCCWILYDIVFIGIHSSRQRRPWPTVGYSSVRACISGTTIYISLTNEILFFSNKLLNLMCSFYPPHPKKFILKKKNVLLIQYFCLQSLYSIDEPIFLTYSVFTGSFKHSRSGSKNMEHQRDNLLLKYLIKDEFNSFFSGDSESTTLRPGCP